MGVAWSNDSSSHRASQIIKFKEAALSIASKHRFDVRTVRLTLPPINSLEQFSQAKANSVLNWFSSLCEESGIRWYCVPLSYYEENASDGLLADIALDIIRKRKNAFVNLKKCASFGKKIGLDVHAGHGLTYKSAHKVSKIEDISEFNIGHFIISDSLFIGIEKTIKKFKKIINT